MEVLRIKHEHTAKAGWHFDNTYLRLPDIFYSTMTPNPVRQPELVLLNEVLAEKLGLHAEALKSEEGVAVLAGNELPEGAAFLSQAYAGHQFGHFTMLGDGRAMLIGEQMTPTGERFDIQLKGSGPTPYSRGGDGRAALGPMLREYIMSEAMHALGIPTTRSLAVIATGEHIAREIPLSGAILTRVGSSHLRFGTFQYAAKWGTITELRELADYAIERHFAEIKEDENTYLSFLKKVINRHASLVAKWQLVGFVHGVMNTDNMTISGETIDYGPCAFLDTYSPTTVFSSIDREGRYAYVNQPSIVSWNLARFAETLLPLLHEDKDKALKLAQEALSDFAQHYQVNWLSGMRSKLGLFTEEQADENLIHELLKMMAQHQTDYTNTFLALTFHQFDEDSLFNSPEFYKWRALWEERLVRQGEPDEAVQQLMHSANPAVIPRNYYVEQALTAAVDKDNLEVTKELLAAISNPYAHIAEQKKFQIPPKPNEPYQTFCGT